MEVESSQRIDEQNMVTVLKEGESDGILRIRMKVLKKQLMTSTSNMLWTKVLAFEKGEYDEQKMNIYGSVSSCVINLVFMSLITF